MNRLDALISYLSPGWGAARARDRAIQNRYEAAIPSRLSQPKPTDNGNADYSIMQAGPELLRQAREIEQNYDVAKGALDIFESRIVGEQLQSEPMVKRRDGTLHAEVNAAIKAEYLEWLKAGPELSGEHKCGDMQRMLVRSWIRDGEVFALMREGNGYPHLSRFPFSLELLESDHLSFFHNRQSPRIIQGVEKGDWRRPVGYHFYETHPGDMMGGHSGVMQRADARAVRHLKLVERFGQTRGVSAFHAAFRRLDDVRDYDNSERVAAKMAAATGMQLLRDPTYLDQPVQYPPPGSRKFGFKPGMFWDNLAPGEKLEMVNPNNRPNAQLAPFRSGQLRMAARALGVSYSSFTGEYTGTYSSERQALVESYMIFGVIANKFILFWDEIYRRFVQMLVLYEFVDLPGDIDPATLYDAAHIPPAMPWIDPKKEIEGKTAMVQAGFDSRRNQTKKMGRNPDEVMAEIHADREQEKALDVRFTTTADGNPAMDQPVVEDGQDTKVSAQPADQP